MANQSGQAYGLTALCPIRAGRAAALRTVLHELPNAGDSPFAATRSTHVARWLVIEKLAEPEGAKPGGLQSAYLLFTSNFDGVDDGGLDGYLKALCAAEPAVLESIGRHCVGFPDITDADAFVAYIRDCQITTTFFFVDYGGDTTVDEALQALMVQREFVRFAGEAQALSPELLHQGFGDFMSQLAQKPTPRPGTF